MIYTYDKTYWDSFQKGNSLEWVITNGIGGYAGASLIGGKNRTHQGLLIASLHAPTCRYVCLENVSEWVSIGDNKFDLETSQHRVQGKSTYAEGQRFLKKVSYDGTIKYDYELTNKGECESGTGCFEYSKHIALKRGENTVVVGYKFINFSADEATVVLTPAFNFREHNTLVKDNDIRFDMLLTGDTLSLVPDEKKNIRIDFSVSEGDYYELADKYDRDIELQTEVDLETEGLCTQYTPYDISISVAPGETKKFSILCTVVVSEDENIFGDVLLEQANDAFVGPSTAEKLIKQVQDYYAGLLEKTGYSDEFANKLILDSDHFLADRCSTGMKTVLAGLPWFTDWGRDTMIAYTGLTLCTRRYEEAREILKTFAMYVHNGMVPNMFPDDGADPLYNTVDASLWYFYAVFKYLEYVRKDEKLSLEEVASASKFVKEEIYPVLCQILDAYEKGTDFSIYMEPNGLLHAGSDLDQITWMDVRVGDMVVTPRHGCPVEINALWYNALCIGESLAKEYEDQNNEKHWSQLADIVQTVFEKEFWNDKKKCLYDVIDGDLKDDSVRPNQIYAVSLPFPILSKERAKAVVDIVEKELYVGVGIRSLSKDHVDYHGQYRGALEKRDLSYHQGTAWGFLLGGFITAYTKVHENDENLEAEIIKLIEPVKLHQSEANCIGGICEIFEGDEPNTGRGCYTQAWSTGEVLRAYVESGLAK